MRREGSPAGVPQRDVIVGTTEQHVGTRVDRGNGSAGQILLNRGEARPLGRGQQVVQLVGLLGSSAAALRGGRGLWDLVACSSRVKTATQERKTCKFSVQPPRQAGFRRQASRSAESSFSRASVPK